MWVSSLTEHQPHKMVKHTQTICRQKPNCLSVHDHFLGLTFKGLIVIYLRMEHKSCWWRLLLYPWTGWKIFLKVYFILELDSRNWWHFCVCFNLSQNMFKTINETTWLVCFILSCMCLKLTIKSLILLQKNKFLRFCFRQVIEM